MTIRHSLLFAALLMALPLAPVLAATPQAATVTYQGQLKEGGQPFTGTAKFDFRLFDAETGGNLIAQFDGVEYQNYPVLDGLLQVELPFIAADFNGDARWLEIRVNGAILDPRQPLTSTPYAVRALGVSALALDGAELQAGAVSLTKLAGNAVNSSKIVDGSITAADININSVQQRITGACPGGNAISSVGADGSVGCIVIPATSSFWTIVGNAGTNPATHFLGTTDDQPLALKVNSQNALRLQHAANTIAVGPNTIYIEGINTVAGANVAAPSSIGVVLLGGGQIDVDGATFYTSNEIIDTAPGSPAELGAGFVTVSGGIDNTAGGWGATIAGGVANEATAQSVTVSGGNDNVATAAASSIGGGSNNVADGDASTVAGGEGNQASAYAAAVSGGARNAASGTSSSVGGGEDNTASGSSTSVGGGQENAASSYGATVAGGLWNAASGERSVIAGGEQNASAGYAATIGGGSANTASQSRATVAGGFTNTAADQYSSVGGGDRNVAAGNSATVVGGTQGSATGFAATVSGGSLNCAGGRYSWAGGNRAKVRPGSGSGVAGYGCAGLVGTGTTFGDQGSFVWADSTNADFVSTGTNKFEVRATGGVRFVSDSGGAAGVSLASGSGAWASLSDRSAKADIEAVDPTDALARVLALPIYTWRYKAQDSGIRHMGPMAQDFHAAFGLNGNDEKSIATVDPDGVALAAIQGLNARLEAENAALRAQLDALMQRVEALEKRRPGR